MDVNGVDLESSYSPAIESLALEGRRTNADVGRSYMEGTNVGKGLLTQPDSFNQGLAYGSPMQAAIKQRYTNDYNFKQSELSHKMLRSASEDHLRNLASTTQMANEEVMQNRQKEMLKNEIEQANKRARGQVLGSVLGIVGGIGGAYLGAGTGAGIAGGGMLGMQAGQGIGNAMGGM